MKFERTILEYPADTFRILPLQFLHSRQGPGAEGTLKVGELYDGDRAIRWPSYGRTADLNFFDAVRNRRSGAVACRLRDAGCDRLCRKSQGLVNRRLKRLQAL